jgi:predicted GNAT family acetyltransferase
MPEKAEMPKVLHNVRASRFEVAVGKTVAVLEYQVEGQQVIFTHTEVPEQFEGQGIASQMARTALAHAREKGYKVVPACEFMQVYLDRHPEYQDLLST